MTCFAEGEHGHDPSHAFHETIEHSVDGEIKALCAPGRGVHHAAVCDGCDKASVTLVLLTHHFINSISRALVVFVTSVCHAQTLTTARTALFRPMRSIQAIASLLSILRCPICAFTRRSIVVSIVMDLCAHHISATLPATVISAPSAMTPTFAQIVKPCPTMGTMSLIH